MKTYLILMIVSLLITTFGIETTTAQLAIGVPDITKIKNTENEQPTKDIIKTSAKIDASYEKESNAKTRTDDKWDNNIFLRHHMEEIQKHTTRIKSYNRKIHRSLFPTGSVKYVMYAISKRERDKWFKTNSKVFGERRSKKNTLDPALDALAVAVAGKLPKYFPHKSSFAFRNPREEKMMKSKLKNIATLKIHLIGLFDRAWRIKTNNYGIPEERYKQGFIWVRDPADDHPYCHRYQVDIIQKYAGGGTYGSKFAFFVGDKLFAC